jgi:cell division protein FtsB
MFKFSLGRSSAGLWLTLKIFAISAAFLYFVFHAVSGSNGLVSYLKIKKQIAEVSTKLDDVKERLDSLQVDVSLLGSKSLDTDILEERSRAILSYSYPEDVIVRSGSVFN